MDKGDENMKYSEYKRHIEIIKKARSKIEENIKILEPKKERRELLLFNKNKIVRKMYLDYLALIDIEEDAEEIDI
jgi:hypothetical protein